MPPPTDPPVRPSAADEHPGTAPSLRRRVWNLVEAGRGGEGRDDEAGGFDWFDWLIAGLIVLNVVALMLETEREIYTEFRGWFQAFEVVSLAVFGVEYVLRIWSCTVLPQYAHPITGRLKFALRPLQLVDLIALLPAVLFFVPGVPDLRFVRTVRLLRILRVLKLGRYSQAVGLLGRVLRQRRGELVVMGLVLVVLLVISASVMHYVEAEAQPNQFGSIPRALWWAIITLTTIGYGDVFPVTPLGRVFAGFIAVAGIGLVALPTAIVAAAFSEELHKAHEARQRKRAAAAALAEAEARQAGDTPAGHLACPHCGKPLTLHPQTDQA